MSSEPRPWNINGYLCFFATQLQILRTSSHIREALRKIAFPPDILRQIREQINALVEGANYDLKQSVIKLVDQPDSEDMRNRWRIHNVPMVTFFISDYSREYMFLSLQCLYPYIKSFAIDKGDISNRDLLYKELNELTWVSISWLPRMLAQELDYFWHLENIPRMIATYDRNSVMHELSYAYVHHRNIFDGSLPQPFDSALLIIHHATDHWIKYGHLAIIPIVLTTRKCNFHTHCVLMGHDNSFYHYRLLAIILKIDDHFILHQISHDESEPHKIIDNGIEINDTIEHYTKILGIDTKSVVGLAYEQKNRVSQDLADMFTPFIRMVQNHYNIFPSAVSIILSKLYSIINTKTDSISAGQLVIYMSMMDKLYADKNVCAIMDMITAIQ